jgi:APA family basic amino acid/polyamine antiporter
MYSYSAMTSPDRPSLVRAMGRWTLAALVMNSMIGSGIFGLPSIISGLIGPASRWAFLIGGIGVGTIMACFAEVASQFPQAGGPYLYTRETFGRFAGLEVGWITWVARLAAGAASANLFVIYLAEFWPGAKSPVPRLIVLTIMIGSLAIINYVGVVAGAGLSNVITVAKLLPLALFIVAGAAYLAMHGNIAPTSKPFSASLGNWLQALVLVVFAYGGFEGAVVAMSEVKDPQRSAPFAIFVGLFTCAVVYTLVQVVVVGVLVDPSTTDRPLALAAMQILGAAGAWIISAGTLLSTLGHVSSVVLTMPRLPFAISERGDFPAFMSAVHRRFQTPHVAIVISAVILWFLAVRASFGWNATFSVLARLFAYGAACAALPILRHREPDRARFRLAAGPVFAGIGLVFSLLLITRVKTLDVTIMAAVFIFAFGNWMWSLRQSARGESELSS